MSDSIKAMFEEEMSQASEILERARICAALTKPWVLPPDGHDKNQKLPETYQSIGSRGINTLEGKLLLALFPPGRPWALLEPSEKAKQQLEQEELVEVSRELRTYGLLMQSVLEAAGADDAGRRRRGFRTAKRRAITSLLVTGDVLEQLTSDYRIKTFRRDQYTTRRDSSGKVLYHCVKEEVDALELPEEAQQFDGVRQIISDARTAKDRMVDLYTRVEWDPSDRKWVTTQEVDEQQIGEPSREPVSAYLSTTYELSPGENYGRGLIELNLGELRSLNELELRRLDMLALAAKVTPVIDQASHVRPRDLRQETGIPITGRVQDGKVMDIGFLHADNIREYSMLTEGIRDKSQRLAATMLIGSDSVRDSERTTAFEVQQVTLRELEGALGGLYAPIADEQQVPLLDRVMYQMKRDRMMPTFPEGSVEIRALTGIDALARANEANAAVNIAQVAAQFGPEALMKFDVSVLIEALLSYAGVEIPGLIKSEEQIQREMQQALEQQAASQTIEAAAPAAVEAMTNA